MALSEYEENILAELENDFKNSSSSLENELKNLDANNADFSANTDSESFESVVSFDPRKFLLGVFGILVGLCLILFAVYSYSVFGIWVTVLSAVVGFGSMVFSISKLMQVFNISSK